MSSPPDGTAPGSMVVLSDLHLATGELARADAAEPSEQFVHDQELTSLIDHVTSQGVEVLLLLGDVFELPGGVARGRLRGHYHEVRVETLIERVDRIARAHPEVIDALRRFVDAEGVIQLVPGNHDHGLHDRAVFDELCRHLRSGTQPTRVELHPWVIHLPGFMYAEHGHAHHVVNAFRDLEHPLTTSPRGPGWLRLEDPLGAALHRAHLARHGAPPRRITRVVASAARSAVAHFWSLRRGGPRRSDQITPLDEVRAATSFNWPRALRALIEIPLRRVDPRRPHYLQLAAERIHRILDAHGQAAPIYVFGHSHRPEARQLSNGTCLLNAGSWASWSRERSTSPPRSFPYGYIWRDPVTDDARCELRWWPAMDSS